MGKGKGRLSGRGVGGLMFEISSDWRVISIFEYVFDFAEIFVQEVRIFYSAGSLTPPSKKFGLDRLNTRNEDGYKNLTCLKEVWHTGHSRMGGEGEWRNRRCCNSRSYWGGHAHSCYRYCNLCCVCAVLLPSHNKAHAQLHFWSRGSMLPKKERTVPVLSVL